MPIEKRKIEDLKPYPNNPKKHPIEKVEDLANLMGKYGFHDSHAIAVDENDEIIWGHGRLMAAKVLGLEEVPVERITGLSEEDKKALRVADNAVGESGWDFAKLEEEVKGLDIVGFNLDLLSLDDQIMKHVAFDEPKSEVTKGSESAEPDKPVEEKETSTKEIDPDEFELEHTCPRCGFEF